MQTNSFSEQIYKHNQINTLSTAKNLILACAIIATIFSVPGLGWLLGLLLQIPMIALFILAIITLVFARKAKLSIIGSILLIIASILSFLTFFIFIYMSNLPNYSAAHDSASLFYTILALFTWILYIVAAIVLFFEFNSANKAFIELKFQNANLFQTPFASPQPISSPQTTPIQHTQSPSEPQPANPFATQPESTTTTNPFISQEHIQPVPIPETPLQDKQITNPFTDQSETAPTTNPFISQEHIQSEPISEVSQQNKQPTNPFLTETHEVQNPELFVDHK